MPPAVKIASSPIYIDTSALAKIYFRERESGELEEALLGRTDLIVSDLAVTELVSAIARRVRRGEVSRRDAGRAYRRAIQDLDEGEYLRAEISPATHREAERLLMTVGATASLRAADALHLALATGARTRGIITYDERMRVVADALGTLDVA